MKDARIEVSKQPNGESTEKTGKNKCLTDEKAARHLVDSVRRYRNKDCDDEIAPFAPRVLVCDATSDSKEGDYDEDAVPRKASVIPRRAGGPITPILDVFQRP